MGDTIEALSARVETLEEQVKEIFARLNDKDSSPMVLSTKLNNVLVTLGEVKKSIDDLKEHPAHLWDTLITSGLAAVIAAAVGLLVAHIK